VARDPKPSTGLARLNIGATKQRIHPIHHVDNIIAPNLLNLLSKRQRTIALHSLAETKNHTGVPQWCEVPALDNSRIIIQWKYRLSRRPVR
jgi:hypothetical protein